MRLVQGSLLVHDSFQISCHAALPEHAPRAATIKRHVEEPHVPERATRRCTRAWYRAACLSPPAPRVGGRNWSSSSVDVRAMGSCCHTATSWPALSRSLPASRSHTCSATGWTRGTPAAAPGRPVAAGAGAPVTHHNQLPQTEPRLSLASKCYTAVPHSGQGQLSFLCTAPTSAGGLPAWRLTLVGSLISSRPGTMLSRHGWSTLQPSTAKSCPAGGLLCGGRGGAPGA